MGKMEEDGECLKVEGSGVVMTSGRNEKHLLGDQTNL
jgi:hypothetical protein